MTRHHPRQVSDTTIEDSIFHLLTMRQQGASICPSEVARALDSDEAGWRPLMPQVRQVAQALARAGRLQVTRAGVQVDATSPGGPIRLSQPTSREQA
jgi:hypothetical protein